MKMRIAALALVIWGTAGCDSLPRDPDDTLNRIREARAIRVGVVGASLPAEARALLANLAANNGARIALRQSSLEPLIVDLDADRIDLVIVDVAERSPWHKLVAPSPPLTMHGTGRDRIAWRALMKNGENRWIMQVEAAARRVSPAAS